ncbi:N-acetyltransferase [Bacillus sp. M6-12]|uniref:GNAT family N-acetyltransferase n=1 Tax=Bacillus sp. M6-12 TaxID=2054166 RepID=UPI000C7607F7|nr:GNAT family N-acetyltransferase [Bacillus sp. M6-12]PLS17262.1 N-acetyltransferase [Bacillus sp. M6-12]
MTKIKRLEECTLQEAVKAWNSGFEGYYFDMTMSTDAFVNRLALEGLSPSLSLVAFIDDQPVGILLNGIRVINGKKFAWNGGTGVAPQYRKQGVARELMNVTLSLYQEEGVATASLEAIRDNAKAISLYESCGFSAVDSLEHLVLKGMLQESLFPKERGEYLIKEINVQHVANLPFYKAENPWQTQWRSAKDSEAILAFDGKGNEVGYAYFRKNVNEQGRHIGTTLFQCEADPLRMDAEGITRSLLGYVFEDFQGDISRIIPNLPVTSSKTTYSILKEIGFKSVASQVFMKRPC